MAKFLTRLFSSRSSSPKRGSFRGSQSSVNGSGRQTGGSSNMRAAASLENLASYYVNPKEMEKHKLHKASWEGNINKVERHSRPDQINAKDQHARTPLHLAVVRGNLDIIKHLIHEGAKLDAVDNERRTPLVKAVLSGNKNPQLTYEICVTLLNEGAHSFINAVDTHNKNALHYAIDFDNENLAALFFSVPTCDPNFRDGDQMTPLHLAVKRNSPGIVYTLLSDEYEHQADPNLTNRNGQTPLHMAANTGRDDIVRIILQANLEEPCDPTIVDAQQLTAYQIAQVNHHDPCAKLIAEYQEGWKKLTPRRGTSSSINEQEINPVLTNPSQRFQPDDDDESSDESESAGSSERSGQFQRPAHQWSERNAPSISATKPENRTLADMIKTNPLQPHPTPTNVPKPNNQGLSSLLHSIPLQPDLTQTNASKPNNQTIASIVHNIPLQPNETFNSNPVFAQQKQPTSLFGIGSTPFRHQEVDSTSASMSIDKPLIAANPLVGQPSPTSQKNNTFTSPVGVLTQPMVSNPNSWSPYSAFGQRSEPAITQAKKVEDWNESSATPSDEDDDDNSDASRVRTPPTGFSKPQPLLTLNGTAMFTTTTTPTNEHVNRSESDEDSIEVAVQQLNAQKAAGGVQNLVNRQIGNTYQFPLPTPLPITQSTSSEHSSWTSTSAGVNKDSSNKGVHSLVQQQPLLLGKKSNEPTWDDSRPLSADLKRTSIVSDSSDESDFDDDKKSATIVKSPFTSSALTNLVQQNIQPTETKSTGVENLAKIIDTIMHSSPPVHKQSVPLPPPPPSTIGKLVGSPLIKRSDSSSSNASSFIDDTVRSITTTTTAATRMKQELYTHGTDQQNWSDLASDGHDLKLLTRKYSNEMTQQSQRATPRSSLHHDFNNLRGSMSSSTSSIQNNMERISELKEDIKQIERKQEDSLELKRQLKDMEIKKNNFEALYKKNDQLLRETETKLEKEINEKQRLEWTTKNLNMELKSVRQKLQSLEDEKDILNQRCIKLKEERDNYDEKLRIHQANTLQTTATGVLREEDIEKIKHRHREEMKLLSAENDDLHQRTRQLQSDLQLHRESLDVTIRYKIDLEKALEEKTFLQHELDRLKHEKDLIEQDKLDYKTKSDNLQEEIRILLLDRAKIEQKLNGDLQEHIKQRQRSTDDLKKYKTQIEQLNMKLGDAEARLLVLQTQKEALVASKDREIKSEFETLTHRLNLIESDKINAEQRYHNEYKEIAHKQQQHAIHEPLVILTSTNGHQHSPSSPCVQCDTLRRSFEQEREQRIQTEKDNDRLRDVVTRQKQQQQESSRSFQQQQENEQVLAENSKHIRSNVERVTHGLDRLRDDLGKLLSNYDPPNNFQQQAQLHSQIDTLRQFYEEDFRKKQSQIPNGRKSPAPTTNGYHRPSPSNKHDEYDHSPNGSLNCTICSNSRLLRERLDNAIDTSLADQRIQTIKQIPILPRQTSPLSTANNHTMSSVELLRKRYYI